MKHMATIFALAASAILLASCTDPQPAGNSAELGIPTELRAIMEANREIALPPPRPDFDSIVAGMLTQDFDREAADRVAAFMRRQAPIAALGWMPLDLYRRITHAQAIEETRYYFDILRYLYVGYGFFGGDDVFLPIRDYVIERLGQASDPLLVSYFVKSILSPAVGRVVADNHFRSAPAHGFYMSEDLTLRRGHGENAGFLVAEIDGNVYRVVETALRDGREIDGALPTITRDGEFAFAFGHFARLGDRANREMTAVLENAATRERRNLDVDLRLVGSSETPNHTPAGALFGAREVDGIAVVQNRHLRSGNVDVLDMDVEPIIESGRAARSEPIVVLDLRNHRGGYRHLARYWLKGFTGQAAPGNAAFKIFFLNFAQYLICPDPDCADCPPEPQPGWFEPYAFRDGAPIPNESLVIVLIDRITTSAGEAFVSYLRALDNVLFVGANTHGNLVVTGMAPETMTVFPHSGMTMQFGTRLHLRPDLSQFEGVGFLPDLWVPPGEALERVLAFIERYGLNR